MSYQPMEPMDTKLCVLRELNLIQSPATYIQTEICTIIAQNRQAFDGICDDPVQRQAAVDANMDKVRRPILIDKLEDCP